MTVSGRKFIWYVHDEIDLHIASTDKRFIIIYHFMSNTPDSNALTIIGREFPGVPFQRPIICRCPRLGDENMETPGYVRKIIQWCLHNSTRPIEYETTTENLKGHASRG